MMKRYEVAIIGCGFVGSHLAKHLGSRFDVATFDIGEQHPLLRKEGIMHKICDVRDFNRLKKNVGKPSVIVHTAIVQIPFINKKPRLGLEVNFLGTQNVCRIVDTDPEIRGLILTGSWHVFGERGLAGRIDEGFGYNPDKVEARAKLYALSKILQEVLIRLYDEQSEDKIYSIIRLGTVLGDGMPEDTAASIFLTNALAGRAVTPFRHSMHRPMFYVGVRDVCRGIERLVERIIDGSMKQDEAFDGHIINLVYPIPITILELAELVRKCVKRSSGGKVVPDIKVIDRGLPIMYRPEDKNLVRIDVSRAKSVLGMKRLMSPQSVIEDLVKKRIHACCE